ncbi:MAG: hypothetical protein AABZ12_13095, partial [Planctomycetota bacterium]
IGTGLGTVSDWARGALMSPERRQTCLTFPGDASLRPPLPAPGAEFTDIDLRLQSSRAPT